MKVVIPFHETDESLAVKNLELAIRLDGQTYHSCLLVYHAPVNPAWVIELANKFFINAVEILVVPPPAIQSWPQAGNHVWQYTARHIAKNINEPWFWWEPDATPLKSEWLSTLADEYIRGNRPFMGHIVEGMGHCNGVAIYPGNVAKYCPDAMRTRKCPWDIMLGKSCIPITHPANHLIGHWWAQTPDGLSIQSNDFPAPSFPTMKSARPILESSLVLFHRCKDGSLANWVKLS